MAPIEVTARPSAVPHRRMLIAMFAAYLATIVVVEATDASEWIAETGVIHLVALAFVVFAAVASARLRRMVVGEFKPFLKRMLVAIVVLGVSHVVEYMIDVKAVVDEVLAPLVVAGLYTVAAAVMVSAAAPLLRSVKSHARRIRVIAGAAIAAPVVIVAAAMPVAARASDPALGPMYMAAIVALMTTSLCAAAYFRFIGRKFPVLAPVVRYACIAVISVALAGLAELASYFLSDTLHVSEWVYENASHYVFYAGMVALYLAFDLPNHFGGVYADMRAALAGAPPGESVA